MSKLQEYLHTDWAAMTTADWIGMILTVSIFIILVVIFVLVFHPKNKEKLESQRHLPGDEDFDSEDK